MPENMLIWISFTFYSLESIASISQKIFLFSFIIVTEVLRVILGKGVVTKYIEQMNECG